MTPWAPTTTLLRLAAGAALLALSLLLLAAVAFWPMYLSRDWAHIDRYTHAHAALGTLWLALLLVQPLLLSRGHRLAHRWLGRAGIMVAPAFVVSGLLLTHLQLGKMSDEAFNSEGKYIYLPLSITALFAVACLLGIVWRQSAQVHGRFMVCTALLLVDPVLARIMSTHLPPLPSENLYQALTFGLIAVVLAALTVTLPPSANGRRWFRGYSIGTVATLALFFHIPHTAIWLAFARWFRGLPLT